MLTEILTSKLLVFLGYIFLAKITFQILSNLYVQIRTYFQPRNLLSIYGKDSYALITGASDGLGKATSFALASHGFNLILVARNKTKLEAVKAEILKKHPKVKIETFVVDFSQLFASNQFKQMADFASGFDLSLIINNVGVLYDNPIKYLDIASKNPKELTEVISVNIVSYVLSHFYFTKKLSERESRSGFVDVSSIVRTLLHTSTDIYGSTKAFNNYFTQSMGRSGLGERIDYLSYIPGLILTQMSTHSGIKKVATDGIGAIEPSVGANEILKALGLVSETNGHWSHLFSEVFIKIIILLRRTWLFEILVNKSINSVQGVKD